MLFWSILRKILLQLYSNVTTLNLQKCLFSKLFPLWNVLNQVKLRGNLKTLTLKNAQKLKSFLGFMNCVEWFISNYCTIKHTHTSLKRTRTKGCRFWLDWNCSEAFEKLKLYMNSDTSLNNFDIPLFTGLQL